MQVEAGLAAAAPVFLLAPAGHRDDTQRRAMASAQPLAHFVAVHLRQADVEQHHVGRERLGALKRARAVERSVHNAAQHAEQLGERAGRVDAATLQLDQPARQPQTDAEAALGAVESRRGLREHPEHARQFIRCDTDAAVLDLQFQGALLKPSAQDDALTGRAVVARKLAAGR